MRRWTGALIVSVKPISGKTTMIFCESQPRAAHEAAAAKAYPWRFAYRINVYIRGEG